MTRWRKHLAEWSDCQRCPLKDNRQHVVLGRGRLPCDVLFIGEAPGISEDSLGVPFVGPAGLLLDNDKAPVGIIQKAGLGEIGLRVCFANLLGCLPLSNDEGRKEPDDDDIRTCSPRLLELVEMASPKLIVCVGALARDWLDPKLLGSIKVDRDIQRVHIDHPARIIRAPWAQRSFMVQRAVVTLRDAVENLCQS